MSDLEQIGPSVLAEMLSLIERERADAYERGRKDAVERSEVAYERGRESGLRDLQNSAHKEYDRGFNDGFAQGHRQLRQDVERHDRRQIEKHLLGFFGCSADALGPGVRTQVQVAASNIAKAITENDQREATDAG